MKRRGAGARRRVRTDTCRLHVRVQAAGAAAVEHVPEVTTDAIVCGVQRHLESSYAPQRLLSCCAALLPYLRTDRGADHAEEPRRLR